MTTCRTNEKTWELKPRLIYWLYRKKIYNIIHKPLGNLQRITVLFTCASVKAPKSSPTASVEAILNLSALDIYFTREWEQTELNAADTMTPNSLVIKPFKVVLGFGWLDNGDDEPSDKLGLFKGTDLYLCRSLNV